MPFVVLKKWYKWFAWRPVRLDDNQIAWLKFIECRHVWFVIFYSEYRALPEIK